MQFVFCLHRTYSLRQAWKCRREAVDTIEKIHNFLPYYTHRLVTNWVCLPFGDEQITGSSGSSVNQCCAFQRVRNTSTKQEHVVLSAPNAVNHTAQSNDGFSSKKPSNQINYWFIISISLAVKIAKDAFRGRMPFTGTKFNQYGVDSNRRVVT